MQIRKTRQMMAAVFVFVIAGSATVIRAQAADPTGKSTARSATNSNSATSRHLTDIVVTASRVARDIQSEPGTVYRLGANEESMHAINRTTPDVLDGIPSVMVQKTSYGQGSPYLRGLTGYRTLCMVNGIRLNNSVFRDGPNQYWNTVDPLSIADYELVMGPGSVLYGSDAIGGVLNALPLEPPAWTGASSWERRMYYRTSTAEGSNLGRIQLGGRVSEHLGIIVGYSLKKFGDLEGGRDVGIQKHTGYDEQDFDAMLKYYIDEDSSFSLGHQTVRQDDAWRTHRTIYGIEWNGLAHGDDKIHSYNQARDLTYATYRTDNLSGLVDGITVTLSRQAQVEDLYRVKKDDKIERQGFDVQTWGGTIQLESESPVGNWTYGLDYYHDIVGSYAGKFKADGSLDKVEIQGPVADDASYDIAGLFVQDTISCLNGRLDVIPGLRYTVTAADAGKVKNPLTGDQISISDDWNSLVGSLRVLVPLEAERHHVVFAGIAQGFRAPNLSDLTRLDTARSNEMETPSPDLDPERYVTGEVGIKSRVDRIVLQFSYYYTAIDGMIVRTPTGNTIDESSEVTKKNSGNGYIQGLEFSTTCRLTTQWSTWISASVMDGKVDAYPASTTGMERDYISRLMPPTGEIGLRWESASTRYWCELVGNAAARADKLSPEDTRDTQRIPTGGTPGYAVCHIRAGARLSRTFTTSAAVENVFDQDYRIHGSGVNEPGRNFTLAAACEF